MMVVGEFAMGRAQLVGQETGVGVFSFAVGATDGGARAGALRTPHGPALTPLFMPVATQGAVKGLTPEEVQQAGAEVILGNAYHLYLRPGPAAVAAFGGLHRFMGWPGPILTDSGGFQAFSLGALKQISESGIQFRSHIDGSSHRFTPELATENQIGIGADIIMCFDQCIAYGAGADEVRRAMERTHRWARQCFDHHRASGAWPAQALFGIVQGGTFPQLRQQSAAAITAIPFDGYAIGGLAVGETKEQLYGFTGQVCAQLPPDKPRYLMGVGSPEDLVEGVARGVDLFDCALPTRVARNGGLFTPAGRIDITKRRYAGETGPLDADCDCAACRRYSAGYLHHLFRAKELLGLRLASQHNLRFILRLMQQIRQAIIEGRFAEFRRRFLDAYQPTNESARQAQKQRWLQERGR